MSWWGWMLVIVTAWVGLSFVVAPLVGRWLRRNGQYYPVPEPVPDEPPVTAASGVPGRPARTLSHRPDCPRRSPMSW